MNDPIHECSVCRAPADTYIAGYRIAGVDLMLPKRFVFAYRVRNMPLGLCNVCFEAGRFDGFTADEIAYFREEFARGGENSSSPNGRQQVGYDR